MRETQSTHGEADALRARSSEPKVCPQFVGAVLLLAVAGWLVGGTLWGAALLGAIGARLAIGERRRTRRALSQVAQITSRAASMQSQRDAAAQLLSLQMGYERGLSVLEALGEGVLVVDGAGEIVLANPAASGALLESAQDPHGRVLWDVLLPELAQHAQEAWRTLREGDRETTPQVRYPSIACDGRVYDLTAVEARSQRTGQDFGCVFLLVDSTRAHELQRLKDRFLSSVSHELRTPLTNICAYSEILSTLMPGESVEWPEFVKVIHEEGLQLSCLVDAMFDYLQLESGEAVFRETELDGGALVREVFAGFSASAATRAIDLQFDVHPRTPRVRGDLERMRQVAHHLIDNALKFTPDGGCVRVTVGCRDEGFELRVEDSGPGVPPDDRQAVFEKFHQLRDHLTDKPSGTGLGLATSRAIVGRFGGMIWCEDSPLGGATFVVLLPGVGQPVLAAGELA